jgi:hypothetical protein
VLLMVSYNVEVSKNNNNDDNNNINNNTTNDNDDNNNINNNNTNDNDDNNYKSSSYSKEFFIPIPYEACLTIGYSLYFTGVSMFIWMALLCFDLFWTFTHLRTPEEQKGCSKKMVIFIFSFSRRILHNLRYANLI